MRVGPGAAGVGQIAATEDDYCQQQQQHYYIGLPSLGGMGSDKMASLTSTTAGVNMMSSPMPSATNLHHPCPMHCNGNGYWNVTQHFNLVYNSPMSMNAASSNVQSNNMQTNSNQGCPNGHSSNTINQCLAEFEELQQRFHKTSHTTIIGGAGSNSSTTLGLTQEYIFFPFFLNKCICYIIECLL